MNRKANGHSASYIKRKAKRIKKEMGITHHEALEKAVQDAGFSNWENFINVSTKPSFRKRDIKISQAPKSPLPKPLLLTYYSLSERNGAKRPNTKMPIESHLILGALLREARKATEYNKRAQTAIGYIQNKLDDWVQNEYTDKRELSDEVFFQMYFGNHDSSSNPWPTAERKQELVKILQQAKEILERMYYDCTPVRDLYKKFALGAKAINNWPLNKNLKGFKENKRRIAKGTLLHLKSNGKPALVIQHDVWNDIIVCYADSGRISTIREEVSVSREQSLSLKFKPMRLFLPYGKWICADGTEVLFNRDYCPIWTKKIDGTVSPIDADTWIEYQDEPDFYFSDSSSPWSGNKLTLAKCLNVLKDWGVESKSSRLIDSLTTAIETGNTDLLKQTNRQKLFPVIAI